VCSSDLRIYSALYSKNDLRSQGQFAEISILPGTGLPAIAKQLQEKGVIRSAAHFTLSARILGLDHKIQAGEYALPFGESNAELLCRLIRAGSNAMLVTFPEGTTAREMASILREKLDLDSAAFMRLVSDSTLLARYNISAPSFEGFLFPDSYNFYRGIEPGWVLQRMVKRFFQVFDSARQAKAAEMGLSVTEAVTLASIIEGEMKIPPEGPLISAVYHNRLKKNMLLQADPTIQYAIHDRRRLYRSDLALDSPYNTYIHPGLPPGPVCNPGKLSIEAALHPAAAPYIFMVSQGDGTHAFNTTLADHLQSKVKLDSLRQVIAAEKTTQKNP
jgi:UPF0755 protein